MDIELGIGDWKTEYNKDTKRIPEELIDPNLRYAGLELKNVTATVNFISIIYCNTQNLIL